MSDQPDKKGERPASKGGNAWDEAKRRVAERNDEARKAGQQQRADHERRMAAHDARRDDIAR